MTTKLIILVIFATCIFYSESTIRLSVESAAQLDTFLLSDFRSGLTRLRSYFDEIVDNLIKKLRVYIVSGGYDPVKVGDIHQNFGWGIFTGKLNLINGSLWNLSTLHRIGEIKFKIDEKEEYLALSFPVGFNDLRYNSNYSAKIWKIGPSGDLKSRVTDIKTNTTLHVHFSNHVLTLNKFNITEAGAITVCFSESRMDWLLNFLSKYTVPYLHDRIINTVQKSLNDFINRTLIEDIYV